MNVNQIIEELCTKFNCTFNELLPQYTHYTIICYSILITVSLMGLLASLFYAYLSCKRVINSDLWDFVVVAIGTISALSLVIGVILLVPWLIDPKMAMIDRIGSMLA